MNLVLAIKHAAESFSQIAALLAGENADDHRMTAVVLRNIANVTEIHGLPGLLGYMACFEYSTPNSQGHKRVVLDVIARILRGDYH